MEIHHTISQDALISLIPPQSLSRNTAAQSLLWGSVSVLHIAHGVVAELTKWGSWFFSLRAGVPLADALLCTMSCASDFRHEGTHHLSLREPLCRLVAGLDVVATWFFTQHPGFEALVVFLGQDVEVDRVLVKRLFGHAGHVVDCHVRLLKIPAAAQVSAHVANALLYRYGGVPVAGVGHTGPLKYGMSDVLRQVRASSRLLPPLEWRQACQ